ncbi:hypothetical protein K466DRAFT_599302 [Polyporus arcularius HHB13444]|uniref:Uncharacterized protein n=1 Tax=Polyporus arcularius HHB13444 TaxID=1314778 RepID=A0A5C3PD42_9APHY|nr:hypothetical protein K466DRAFT_599302 [Polyporus arcularius HHB13444]
MLPISGIAKLPVELSRTICEAADRRDLYSIALSGWQLNAVVTPILYSTIDLQVPHAIYACVRTLASVPARSTTSRDLAGFVETLSLRDPDDWAGMSVFNDSHRFILGRRLADAIPRMRRLRSITCRIGFPHALQIFAMLASGALPGVNAIDIRFAGQSATTKDAEVAGASVAVGVTGLKTVKLDWTCDPPESYQMLMRSLVVANYKTLCSLAIRHGDSAEILKAVWRSIPSFPALQELDVSPDLLTDPASPDTSSVLRLSIPEDYCWYEIELPSTAVPNLQDITCFPRHLRCFLPDDAEHRRPISAVTFNHVRYERTRSGGYYAMEDDGDVYDWWDIWSTLRPIYFSGCPLLRLGFAVRELRTYGLSTLVPLIKDLEYLLIVAQKAEEEPAERRWDEAEILALAKVFSQMPRLHTFLLSDGLLKALPGGGPFEFAHDEGLQRRALATYDQHSSSLRRVAFTTEFEWEKREDGWHLWGHAVAKRGLVSDGEDEDKESDGP